MVHMHYTQPLKIKFGTNHFFGSETLVPIQYRERVKTLLTYCAFFLSSVPMFGFWMGGRCLVSAHSDRKFVNKGQ